jgi:hypothetical protein
MRSYAPRLSEQANVMFGQEQPLIDQQPRLTSQQDLLRTLQDPIMQQAFDPQQALYNRTVQQTQEQTRAGLEARGLDMSPYGAGVEGSALSNFNIDWQNNQLQRMLQGASGVGGLAGQIGQLTGAMDTNAGAIAGLGNAGNQLLQGAGNLLQGAGSLDTSAAGLQDFAASETASFAGQPNQIWQDILQNQRMALDEWGAYGQRAAQPYDKTSQNWQNIQNQFLTANQQGFNQNQTSGFEDPFAMLQLQSQIEMQREQMNLQNKMAEDQKKQQQQQMMMQGASSAMGMMGGK